MEPKKEGGNGAGKMIKRMILIIALILTACSDRMSLDEAQIIARNSECSGSLTESAFYNENSRTWWIELDLTRDGCAPACVVHENGTAEINWRCTGLLP